MKAHGSYDKIVSRISKDRSEIDFASLSDVGWRIDGVSGMYFLSFLSVSLCEGPCCPSPR